MQYSFKNAYLKRFAFLIISVNVTASLIVPTGESGCSVLTLQSSGDVTLIKTVFLESCS